MAIGGPIRVIRRHPYERFGPIAKLGPMIAILRLERKTGRRPPVLIRRGIPDSFWASVYKASMHAFRIT